MGSNAIVVMMSDFGAEHWFDAAMKGEILSRAPHAVILELFTDHGAGTLITP